MGVRVATVSKLIAQPVLERLSRHWVDNMAHDLDEMQAEAAMSDEKAQRAMVDAARLADELRNEQDHAMELERDKKLLECQVG